MERELSFSEQLLRELQKRWGRARGGEREGAERGKGWRERVIFFRATTKRTPKEVVEREGRREGRGGERESYLFPSSY